MENTNNAKRDRLKYDLIGDIFLTVVLPLLIVIAVFLMLRGGGAELPNLPCQSPDDVLFAIFPELSFASLFVWALARRRLTACLLETRGKLDFLVLFGVVMSSLCLMAMLYYSWTEKKVHYWALLCQVVLLLFGVLFNTMITAVDCRQLRPSEAEQDENNSTN